MHASETCGCLHMQSRVTEQQETCMWTACCKSKAPPHCLPCAFTTIVRGEHSYHHRVRHALYSIQHTLHCQPLMQSLHAPIYLETITRLEGQFILVGCQKGIGRRRKPDNWTVVCHPLYLPPPTLCPTPARSFGAGSTQQFKCFDNSVCPTSSAQRANQKTWTWHKRRLEVNFGVCQLRIVVKRAPRGTKGGLIGYT